MNATSLTAAGQHPRRSATIAAMSVPAFERVVEEHGAAVLRVCRALLGAEEAQDAWSETFLAALAAYPRLRPGSNVRAWLLTIAHNKGIDLARRRARTPIPIDPDAVPIRHDESPSSRFDQDLIDALSRLPQKQRAAVAYHYLAELPYAQVGELIDSSEAAARRSAADGLASLRKMLGKEQR